MGEASTSAEGLETYSPSNDNIEAVDIEELSSDETREEADEAAHQVLRNALLQVPNKVLISVLSKELTDAQFNELVERRKKDQGPEGGSLLEHRVHEGAR